MTDKVPIILRVSERYTGESEWRDEVKDESVQHDFGDAVFRPPPLPPPPLRGSGSHRLETHSEVKPDVTLIKVRMKMRNMGKSTLMNLAMAGSSR